MLPIARTRLSVQRRTLSRVYLQSILQTQSVRFESTTPPPPTQSTQPSDQPSQSSPPRSSQQGQGKSKHKLVYREIWPPLIRVLAYASATYFSLQLLWQYLDGEEQRTLERDVRRQLEEDVRNEMKKKAEQTNKKVDQIEQKAKGWFSWLTGK